MIAFIVLVLVFSNLQSQNSHENIGPKNGTLVIVGGAMRSDSIINRFIELAGGIDAHIVFIPTASGMKSYDENYGFAGTLRNRGANNITVLHTNDKAIANSDSFVEPLRKAKAVWFGGGRQWRLVDSYKNTLTEKLIVEVLERGGVVGGSSAGATIQGSYLVRGDTKNNQIMMGDHQEGFGLLKDVAIDQHVLARNRQFDMFEILKKHPELLGIGIDENTAIIVQGNTFEVIGENYVLVYDGGFWSREGSGLKNLPEKSKLFYFLRNGDKYDLSERKIKLNNK
ncbi:cyanophycinase [Lentimicrobium sp. L6]|nr:cyanophycinase [Lentimicrobium sp. S6]NPD86567.1 cyanophycinase [Lentimicrobium sp. L6]